MDHIVLALISAVLQAVIQGLFEKLVPWNKFAEFIRDKLLLNRGDNKILFDNLTSALKLVQKALSDDALEKQLTSQTNREWVERLTDAVNQTADLLDEIYSLGLAKSQPSNESTLDKHIQISIHKLEEMTKTLEDIVKLKDVHGSKESSSKMKSLRLESTSLVDEVYGRDEDKKKIWNFLVEKSDRGESDQRNGKDIPLIAIIGMAGIGKTALAQLLFNDSNVKSCFSPRAWVHVSEDMDVFKVTKTLYEKVTGQKSDIQNLDTLQVKLVKELKNKRFLFVFDEVWNEHHDKWDELQKVLKNGARKSRIIVTTQSKEAALTMRASRIHHLQPLDVKACWSVFAKQAFGRPSSDSSDAPLTLKQTDEEIWKKCGGLPLVARELGSLFYKVPAEEWEYILNENLFDLSNDKSNLLTWFGSSFNHLSSPFLKQCFTYCSIIPKGQTFERERLILLWMAQGFLLQQIGGRTMEEVGIKYFQELVTNSFFQQARDDDKSLFKMHDLINELAQFASTIPSCLVEKGKSPNISDKTRHVSYVCDGHDKEADLVDVLRKAKFLWTFIQLSLSNSNSSIMSCCVGTEAVKELVKQNRLRVLSLSYQRDKLPDDLKKLLHLRYLDLSGSAIVELPEQISSLYTLQTLILSHCENLIKLPANMADLIYLGHLDLTNTTKLEMMPPAFGKLKSLRILTDFVVGNCHEVSRLPPSSIEELGKLSLLRGKLSISKLQNVRNNEDAENAKLHEKEDVKELEFKWISDGQHHLEEVLEKLHPHEGIEKLSIEGYGGTRLPTWLGDSLFSKMVSLRLEDCRNCSTLPSLGQLSSLQQLHVRKMPNCKQWLSSPGTGGGYLSLQELHVEECGELTAIPNNLASLKLLHINACRQLKFDDFVGYELQELYIENCEELTVIPNNLTSLKELFIDTCRQLKFDAFMDYKKLQILNISRCDGIKKLTLNFCRELESLEIHDCKDLRFLRVSNNPHQDLKFLEKLKISECPYLENFYGRLPASGLTSFSVSNCKCLRSMPKQMHTLLRSLLTLDISDCPNLVSFPNGGLPLSLQTLTIKNCVKLTPQTAWGLKNMKSLTHLIIDCAYDKVTSFPDDDLLPASLKYLQIINFSVLRTLNLNGLQDLILLKSLQIHCNQLEILTEGILPLSLSDLSITGCASLTENCEKNQGNYWNKISHIPTKIINGKALR